MPRKTKKAHSKKTITPTPIHKPMLFAMPDSVGYTNFDGLRKQLNK
jgi:hypothetical protein